MIKEILGEGLDNKIYTDNYDVLYEAYKKIHKMIKPIDKDIGIQLSEAYQKMDDALSKFEKNEAKGKYK